MADDDTNTIDDTDEHDGSDHGMPPAADPHTLGLMIAVTWCRVANNKTLERAIKKLDKLDRRYADGQAQLAAVTAAMEQKHAELAEREAAIAVREVALEERETAFESQAGDVRDELREHHAQLEQTHRQLVHRIMSTAGITGNWNFDLQAPPTWQQLRRMIADLPDDPPAPSTEVSSQETVRHDWAGSEFIPDTTLTRTVRGAA